MRTGSLSEVLAIIAFGVLASSAPALATTQESPPAPCASDAAKCERAAADQTDAASHPSNPTPSTESRADEPFGHVWLGAVDGDITLVVFADYACPACREAQPVIDQLLAQDKRLKVVYRLLDNDQGGRTAALTSLAVGRTSASWSKFHRVLDGGGDLNDKTIAAALVASGVQPAELPNLKDQDPQTLPLADELSRNDLLINKRNGTALPSWLIGDGPAQKGFDLPRLQAAIAKARSGKIAN